MLLGRFEAVWPVSDPVLVGAVISGILTVVALPPFLCGYCGSGLVKIEPHSQIFRSRRTSLGWIAALAR